MIASAHNATAAMLAVAALEIRDSTFSTGPEWLILAIMALIGLISHYLTDAIPHGHYPKDRLALKDYLALPKDKRNSISLSTLLVGVADLVFSFILFAGLFAMIGGWTYFIYFFIAFIGAQLPDFIMILNNSGVARNSKLVQFEQSFHAGPVHWHDDKYDRPKPWTWHDIWQVSLIVLAVIICVQYL